MGSCSGRYGRYIVHLQDDSLFSDTSSTNVYLLVYLFMHGYRLTKATSMAIHAFIGISLDLYMLKIVTVSRVNLSFDSLD